MKAKFLGAMLSADGGHDEDTKHRGKAARRIWAKLAPQLPRLGIPNKKLGMVLRSTVGNCMLYAHECRMVSGQQMHKCKVTFNKAVRGTLHQRIRSMHDDQVTMANLYQQLELRSIESEIDWMQQRFIGHTARRHDESIEKKML